MIAGCGGPSPPAPDGGLDASAAPDMAPAQWKGTVSFPFRASLHWADGVMSAQGPVAAANFDGNAGTIVYHGKTLDAAIYRSIPFSPYQLAAVVATEADNLIVLYAYCQNGGVNNWYFESLDEPVTLQLVNTTGTCDLPPTPAAADLTFDVFGAPPPDLLHAAQATVTGADLHIDQGKGGALLDGAQWDVTAFDWVDCSTCGGAGWYEMHSLLRNGPAVAFGIFYLQNDAPSQVLFTYGFRFDVPGEHPSQATFPATWVIH